MSLDEAIRNSNDQHLLDLVKGYPEHTDQHRLAALEIKRRESVSAKTQEAEKSKIEAARHTESISLDKEAIAQSRRANHLSGWAIVIAVVALAVATASFALQWHDGHKPSTPPKPLILEPAKPLPPLAPAFSQPMTNATPINTIKLVPEPTNSLKK